MSQNPADNILQLLERGEVEAALIAARAALPASEGEPRGRLLLLLSQAHGSAGQLLDALRAAAAAGEVFKAAGSRAGSCDALIRVGNTLRAGGDHAAALTALEQADELARELGEPVRRVAVLRNVGVSCSIIGRHQQALSYLNEALAILPADGDLGEQLSTRLSLYNAMNRQAMALGAGTAQAQAQAHALLEPWQVLADDCARSGYTRLEAMARGNHAITLHDCGRTLEASAELQGLLGRYRELGLRPNEAICHNELGRCHEALQDATLARQHYQLAIAMLRDGGSLDDLQQALEGLSRAEEALGHLAAALAALREVRAVDRRKSDDAARNVVAQRELRIELARLTSLWAQQATQDPLTGLGNRRALERWLGEHLPRVEQGERLTLLLMDLDHFKQVNDRFGHDVGDAVLKEVAQVIQRHCRSRDLAVRYGGEEFLLALTGLRAGEGLDIGQRVRESIAQVDWQSLRPGLAVTVSIGVTEATEAADSAELLTLADQRLYSAKLNGRNRVVAA